jgi:predicted transcriptional regulator YdeE
METRIIEKDIPIVFVTAHSFPDGILDAFEQLHVHFPFSPERNFYGLSRPEDDKGPVYKAAAEIKSADESKKSKLETMVIPKGRYISETVHNFKDDISLISKTFETLLDQPNIDPQGYCVEWYMPNDTDVVCMVRLDE